MKHLALKKCCSLAVLAFAANAIGQQLPPDVRNFVSCPIIRDTTTVPCWLSEYEGELYYLGIQTDVSAEFHPPFLGHKVIVEGRIADKPRICGGLVLEPVKISVVAELDANCNTMLPADERFTIDFNPRPPGPSSGRLSFQSDDDAAPIPQPLGQDNTFTLYHYFDSGISGRHAADLNAIYQRALAIGAGTMLVTGYQGDLLLSDGSVLKEQAGLAARRANETAAMLLGAGLQVPTVTILWEDPIVPDGVDDWQGRRTEVVLFP